MVITTEYKSARKNTSGSSTIQAAKCHLKKIIINDAGQKCIVVIKDDTAIKSMFMPEHSATTRKPDILEVDIPIGTSLKVELYKLDPTLLLNFNNVAAATCEDLSGGNQPGRDGTLTNMENADWAEDQERGKHMNFDGVNEHILFGDNFDIATGEAFSISFWIYKASASGAGDIMSKSSGAGDGWLIHCLADESIRFFMPDAGGSLIFDSTNTIPNNTWTHITITMDTTHTSAGANIYFDGVAETLANAGDTLTAAIVNAVQFTLGARNAGGSQFLIGKLDEVMMFDRELSAAEVEFIYLNGYGYSAVDGSRLADLTLIYED